MEQFLGINYFKKNLTHEIAVKTKLKVILELWKYLENFTTLCMHTTLFIQH